MACLTLVPVVVCSNTPVRYAFFALIGTPNMQPQNESLHRRDLSDVQREADTAACSRTGCCDALDIGRRTFVKLAVVTPAAPVARSRALPAMAGPFSQEDLVHHCVPADKKLQPQWIQMLGQRGVPAVYQHADLATIGMPVGGIVRGQLYITGDGRLAHWDIFNLKTAGYGYPRDPAEPGSPVRQGFAVLLEKVPTAPFMHSILAGFPMWRFAERTRSPQSATNKKVSLSR